MSATYAKTAPTADEVAAVLGTDCKIEMHSADSVRFSRALDDTERAAVEALYHGVFRKVS